MDAANCNERSVDAACEGARGSSATEACLQDSRQRSADECVCMHTL